MKCFAFPLFLLAFFYSHAQSPVRVFSEKSGNGVSIYAENKEHWPVSLSVAFTLTNLRQKYPGPDVWVVPQKATRYLLCQLEPMNNATGYQFSYRYKTVNGDVTKTTADTAFVYDLPFAHGAGFRVLQGYNGQFSHQNQFALDFLMDDSTEITAARDGVVVRVVEENNIACVDPSCRQYNNYVLVFHDDGSFAEYSHLRKDGALVSVGQHVTKGMVIGLSGNTGYSTRPHLHFECFLPGWEQRKTVPTIFRTGSGNMQEHLKESKLYLKEY